MALSIEKLLGDAQILVARLRDHDSTADILIAHTETLHKRLDAMKQVSRHDTATYLNMECCELSLY